MQLAESDLAAALQLLAGDAELITLILELTSLQEERQRDPDKGDAREEDTDRRDGLSYLRPAIERAIVGMQQQEGGDDEAGGHNGDADEEGRTGECGTQGPPAHWANRWSGIAVARSLRAVCSRVSIVAVSWVIHPPDCAPVSP